MGSVGFGGAVAERRGAGGGRGWGGRGPPEEEPAALNEGVEQAPVAEEADEAPEPPAPAAAAGPAEVPVGDGADVEGPEPSLVAPVAAQAAAGIAETAVADAPDPEVEETDGDSAEPEAGEPAGDEPVAVDPARSPPGLRASSRTSALRVATTWPPSVGAGAGRRSRASLRPSRAPEVSNADPVSAVHAAAGLKPHQMLQTLGGAEQAAANDFDKEQAKLQAEPPTVVAGGPGAQAADERFPDAPPSRPQLKQAVAKTDTPPAAVPPPPPHAPKAPLAAAPAITGDAQGNVSEGDAAKIQAGIANLPTSDSGAAVPNLPAPKVALTGAADPGHMTEQQAHLDETVAHATAQGRAEAMEPAGEDHLAPTLGAETIHAEIPQAPPAAAAGPPRRAARRPGGLGDRRPAGRAALSAAVSSAAAQVADNKQQHAANVTQQKAAAAEQAAAEETKGKADQLAEHAAAKAGVTQAKQDWTDEQQTQATAAQTEAHGSIAEAGTQIQAERTKAETEAAQHVQAGRDEAEKAKQQGEQDAKKEQEKAKQDSGGGGFFGWVKSKATALYNSVKDGITNIFNKVRGAITAAINKARELANAVIDRAVKFVADKVKAVASRILAIGDRLIPGFQALRTKFRNFIVARIKQAVQALNRIVTAVKDTIKKAFQAIGKALQQGLDLLKKGMQAAINAVKSAVKAAIDKAKAIIATLGTFATLIKDIAANPGQWLRNLGAAVMDGIKNHLWAALKQAVQAWFNDKVESLLGLGKSVWNLLTKGGIAFAQVGKMVWEGLKAAIPPALIALLVERLVAMIVPAAGAIMAIISGLQAAWGAIQRIMAAIDRFVAFLKAVKSGNAGPAFATALAAAAVAVIEFVSSFLLRKIAGAAKKIAGRIKAIAQKIGQKLMAVLKKVGGKIKSGWNKLKTKAKSAKDKLFGPKKKKSPEDERKEKQDRLDKAARELTPKIQALVDKGVGRLRLKAQLAYWRLRYRLTSLEVTGSGHAVTIKAKVNPETDLIRNVILTTGSLLHEQVDKVWPIVMENQRVKAAVQQMRDQRSAGFQAGQPREEDGRTVQPYNRTSVDDPHVPGAAGLDVLTGSQMADGKPRPAHTIESHNFLLDANGRPLTSTSERQEAGGPGKIFVSGGGTYSERLGELGGLSQNESMSLGEAMLAMHAGRPLPAGANAKQIAEFTRLSQVEQGRDKGSYVTLQMIAQLMAQGKMTASEGILQHQMSDVGAMDISRRAQEQRDRQARMEAALLAGETPARKDTKDPWRGPRKFEQGGVKHEEPWEQATGRFWDREKEAVVRWLETRMLLDPYFFTSEERFLGLLKNELPEYLADHIIKGTMLESPATKPTFTSAGPHIPGAAAGEILGGG